MEEIVNDCGTFSVRDGVLCGFRCAEDNYFKLLTGPYERDEKYINRLDIPEGVTAIPAGAFDGYRLSMDLTLPKSLRRIGDGGGGAFRNFSAVTVKLPQGLEFLADGSFFGGVFDTVSIPDEMDARMMRECIYQFDTHAAYSSFGYPVEKVRDLPAPEHAVREIRNECGSFYIDACGALMRFVPAPENNAADCPPEETKELYDLRIPEGVTSLLSYAFEGYTVRRRFELPRSLVMLGAGMGWCAFQCSSLPEVRVPAGIRRIGMLAFGSSIIKELWYPNRWGCARYFKNSRIVRLHLPADRAEDNERFLRVLRQNNAELGEVLTDMRI